MAAPPYLTIHMLIISAILFIISPRTRVDLLEIGQFKWTPKEEVNLISKTVLYMVTLSEFQPYRPSNHETWFLLFNLYTNILLDKFIILENFVFKLSWNNFSTHFYSPCDTIVLNNCYFNILIIKFVKKGKYGWKSIYEYIFY